METVRAINTPETVINIGNTDTKRGCQTDQELVPVSGQPGVHLSLLSRLSDRRSLIGIAVSQIIVVK